MTTTVSQIRKGLQTRLKAISGLQAHAFWPDTVNTPAAVVKPMSGQYHQAMGDPGFQMVSFEITLAIAATAKGLERGQIALDPYLDAEGTRSIKAAIEGDLTLGGLVSTLIVSGWDNYGAMAIGKVADIEYLGAQIQVTVWP